MLKGFSPGSVKTERPLVERLGSQTAFDQLVKLGHLRRRTRRIRRSRHSFNAARLLSAVPADGTTLANARARAECELTPEHLQEAKLLLLSSGEVETTLWQGGPIRLTSEVRRKPARGVTRESALFEPVRLHLVRQAVDGAFVHATVTASGKGGTTASGHWMRPDVARVRIARTEHTFLPAVDVIVDEFRGQTVQGCRERSLGL